MQALKFLAKIPKIIHLEQFGNPEAGFLVSTQVAEKLPFAVKRVFWLHQVPVNYTRGHHAHHTTEEILICLQGSVTVTTETAMGTQTFILDKSETALYLPPQCWVTLHFSANALLLCLTSTDFDPADYIQDYQVFRNLIHTTG